MSAKVVLITGANRGFGRGFAEAYLQHANTIVLACVRDPCSSSSKSLATIKAAPRSTFHLIKLDVTTQADYDVLAETFTNLKVGLLDIVIANAGIFNTLTTIADTDPVDLLEHIGTNTIGPLRLFKATRNLLLASRGKFVAISALSSSITEMENLRIPAASHGASKAALNYIVREMHFENEAIVAFSLDPGYVQTDLSENGAKVLGLDQKGMSVAESVEAMLKVIENASREETSGSFMQYNGERWRW